MNWLNNSNGPYGIEIWGWCGVFIIVLFVGCWTVSMGVYRWKRIEEAGFGRSPPTGPSSSSQ